MKGLPIAAIAVLMNLSFSTIDHHPDLSLHTAYANSSRQMQTSGISINEEDLIAPYWLKVRTETSLSYLSGSIFCNGRIIKHLGNGTTSVNLSPYLQPGENNIVIRGRYSPSDTTIDIDLSSSNNQVHQSVSGSGTLDQAITIDVQ